MKTVLHTYNISTSTPEGKAEWCELEARLKIGPHCHGPVNSDCWSKFRELDGTVVELETTHLFDNQWNTDSIRVFDWALESMPDYQRHIKRGHYLEQTAEMREIRRNTHSCGYCGKQEPAAKGYTFCPHCIDSEYLKESDLWLTRMMPVDTRCKRDLLNQAESDHLLPLYREAQTKGKTESGKARLIALRARVIVKCDRIIENAFAERDGYLWLMDHGLGQLAVSNVIFYDHTGRFCFGWRKPLSAGTVSAVLDIISEFRFSYDIKCENGRILSGN